MQQKARPRTDGVTRFNNLAGDVPEEVATLMSEAGRNESEQPPRFRATGPLRMPIASAR